MIQKCSYCGADLPENSRFCGKCGSVQDSTATAGATSRSNEPQPYWTPDGGTLPASQPPYAYPPLETYITPGNQPSWSPHIGSSATPPPPLPPQPTENEDERGGIPPWSPQYGAGLGADALMSGGQPYGYGAPAVQGTPQIGGVPGVSGTPTPYSNPPAGHLAQGPGYQSPITHYPQAGQQPTYYPPQQGTPEQHPHPGHHGHLAQHAHHGHHAAAGATKVAGASGVKTIIIVVVTVVVVAAGGIGAAAYFFNRPQPLINITSNFKNGSTLLGANGTVLHITGQKFSGNSAITFLLDGNTAPGNPSAHSDSSGNFNADVKITDAWSVGTHTLTARDASSYSTKNSVSVTIVQPGTAHTPGPNGAPPDDATFTISLSAKGNYNLANQPFTTNETLHITGHPDPAGGTVCQDVDTGQKFSSSSVTLDTHIAFTETYSFSCKGSYKGGKITYTETLVTDVITYPSSGVSCTLIAPRMNQQVTGSYTSSNTFTGTFVYGRTPQSDFHCTDANSSFFYIGGNATWTGTVGGL